MKDKIICDEAWDKFMLLGNAIMFGSEEYNAPHVKGDGKKKGNTIFGNRDADIFDVFNFWREEILAGQVYAKEYLDGMVAQAIAEEPNVAF